MLKTMLLATCFLAAGTLHALACSAPAEPTQEKKQAPQKKQTTWTDANDKTLPEDFKVQGEYVGEFHTDGKLGAQVIALGDDAFQAVLFYGGLPGDGWDGKNRIVMDGKRDKERTSFVPATGDRKYIAKKAEQFSATAKFPPPGHMDATGSVIDGVMIGKCDDGKTFELKKTVRKSPTIGLKPPSGADVLFDGTSLEHLKGGRIDKERGTLNTDGKDITTKKKFLNYSAHVEFFLPYRPSARGQERANSGLYMINLYEVQILDSFGLEGKNNECGGVYQLLSPKVNMCLPPLQWQTYDIDFTSAVMDDQGKNAKKARLTVKHNGVLIHDNAEIKGPTGGARNEPEGTPGPLLLQGHGNPLQFKNVWLLEKK